MTYKRNVNALFLFSDYILYVVCETILSRGLQIQVDSDFKTSFSNDQQCAVQAYDLLLIELNYLYN